MHCPRCFLCPRKLGNIHRLFAYIHCHYFIIYQCQLVEIFPLCVDWCLRNAKGLNWTATVRTSVISVFDCWLSGSVGIECALWLSSALRLGRVSSLGSRSGSHSCAIWLNASFYLIFNMWNYWQSIKQCKRHTHARRWRWRRLTRLADTLGSLLQLLLSLSAAVSASASAECAAVNIKIQISIFTQQLCKLSSSLSPGVAVGASTARLFT